MSVFPYEHGRPVGYNAQMGLIVLQSDETLEYELRRIFPEDGVALYTARIPSVHNRSQQTALLKWRPHLQTRRHFSLQS